MFYKKSPINPDDEANFDLSAEYTLEESKDAGSAVVVASRPTKPSIISEGFEFVGTITSEGTLNIAGIVKGKITAKAVLVDVEGQVEGELNSDSLMIKGKVIGDVRCQELNIGPRAYVDGTVTYQNIHIQRGGKIAGKFIKNN